MTNINFDKEKKKRFYWPLKVRSNLKPECYPKVNTYSDKMVIEFFSETDGMQNGREDKSSNRE